MATLQEDMSTYLVSKGLINGYGVDCFGDIVPPNPDHVVVLYEYVGDPINVFTDVVHRSLQVMVRDVSPDVARSLSVAIHQSLQSENLIVQFTPERFGQVYLRQSPFKLETDENDRAIYCFNIGITTTMN